MSKSEITPIKIIAGLFMGVLIALMVAIVVWFIGQLVSYGGGDTGEYATNLVGGNTLTYAYTEGAPRLGNQVLFPEGWHPVLYAADGSAEGRYICERDGEYRICIPRVVVQP